MKLLLSILYFLCSFMHFGTAIHTGKFIYCFTGTCFFVCSILSFLIYRDEKKEEWEDFFRIHKCYLCKFRNIKCQNSKNSDYCYNDDKFELKTELKNLSEKELRKEIARIKKIHNKRT